LGVIVENFSHEPTNLLKDLTYMVNIIMPKWFGIMATLQVVVVYILLKATVNLTYNNQPSENESPDKQITPNFKKLET
jgi:hypothetical protein